MVELDRDALFEAFEYLDELRESGRTNMFGASNYIISELGWDRNEAREATTLWMETFSNASVEERVGMALAK